MVVRSAAGHRIDWSEFDRNVDQLSARRLRQELKLEARLRAAGTGRNDGRFEA